METVCQCCHHCDVEGACHVSCSTLFATTVITPIYMKTTLPLESKASMYVTLVGRSACMLMLEFRGTCWPHLICSLLATGCCWGSICLLHCRPPQQPSMPALVFRTKNVLSHLRHVPCNSVVKRIPLLKTIFLGCSCFFYDGHQGGSRGYD